MRRLAVLLGLAAIGAAPPPSGEVVVAVDGLRSAKGLVQACLTAKPKAFPDCRRDPASRRLTVRADDTGALRFAALPSGRYAVSLLHDENANGRPDMALLLPREGFGFSRDAPVRFGPPKFARAAFSVGGGSVAMPIRMRYLL
jgi:uncharacterized protein (DUF2141 family)